MNNSQTNSPEQYTEKNKENQDLFQNDEDNEEYFCYHIDCSFKPTKCYYCYKLHMQITTAYQDNEGNIKEHKTISFDDLDTFFKENSEHAKKCKNSR